MRLLSTSVGRARALRHAVSTMARTFSNPDAVAGRPVSDQPSSTTPPEKRGFTRTLLMAVALSVVMAGAGYLAGRLRAWSALRETETQLQVAVEEHERAFENAQADHRTALSEAEATAERARAQRAQLVELTTLYEGYRTAQMALLALDARNFGIAESHLREAERILAPLASEVKRLPEVLARVDETDIEVASNLEAQRQSVLSLVGELDAVIAAERAARGVENVGAAPAATNVTDAAVAADGKATSHAVP